MSKFPDFHDHAALYEWWKPVIVAHAVRCLDFQDAMQTAFVKLAEAAGRYNGTGPFINYFSLCLMSIRGETRDRAQEPTVSLDELVEREENWAEGWQDAVDAESDPGPAPEDDLFDLMSYFTSYTVGIADLPGDGNLDNPDPLYIVPPTVEEPLPGQPYAIYAEDHDPTLQDGRPERESHFAEDWQGADDTVLGLIFIADELAIDPDDEDENDEDTEIAVREAGLERPSSTEVRRNLETFLARLDPYQQAFVKATLSGKGPQQCREAALAAFQQAKLRAQKASVHANAIRALMNNDLHAACAIWQRFPVPPTMEEPREVLYEH